MDVHLDNGATYLENPTTRIQQCRIGRQTVTLKPRAKIEVTYYDAKKACSGNPELRVGPLPKSLVPEELFPYLHPKLHPYPLTIAYAPTEYYSRIPYARHLIGYTMWETSTLPPHFREAMSQTTAVWVPTEMQRRLLWANGVNRQIEVVPLGVDVNHFRYREPVERDEFVVLALGALSTRKGPAEIVRAFEIASDGDPNWRLILKSHMVALPRLTDPRITVLNGVAAQSAIRDLYYQSDAYLSMSRGEGFNLPLVEAMACGLECVYPAHTSMTELADETVAYPIYGAVEEPVPIMDGYPAGCGTWLRPDVDEAARRLREAHENVKARRRKGKLASRHVLSTLTIDHTVYRVARLIEQYVKTDM